MSWSVDLMGLPIKLHPMSPVMDGTNSLAGSAPHPRSISASLSPSSFLSLSLSPQLSALPSTSYHCTSSVSPSQHCHSSRSGSHLPPGSLQLPVACPSHLIKLFILGSRHGYCLLIFQMLFWSYSAEKVSPFVGILIIQRTGFHKDIVIQVRNILWPCLSYPNLLTTLPFLNF